MKKIFKWLEQKLFTGEILKDYGVLDQKNIGIARMRTSLLLCRRKSRVQLVFRSTAVAPMAGSVHYVQVDATPDALRRLGEIVLDAGEYLKEGASVEG